MRRLLIAILVLAGLWAGWWALARAGYIRAINTAEAEVASNGIDLDYASRRTGGFPNRIDTTWRDVSAGNGNWRYEVPLAQVFALSYRPDKAIAFAPGPHILDTPLGRFQIQTDDARASVQVVPGRDLVIERATAEADAVRVSLNGARMGSATRTLFSMRRQGPPEGRVQLYGLTAELSLPELRGVPESWPDGLPRAVDTLEIEALAELSADPSLRGASPTLHGFEIVESAMVWGEARFGLTGALDVNTEGALNGNLTVTGENWELILDAMVALGFLDQAVATTWAGFGEGLTKDGVLTVPLPVQDGRVMFGLLPIAQLPRIR